ncbi:hypothetical protein H2203_005957 [Taxawa tesnikishii (nom. ined.)]|nr:hypothetical protein H2203_005957 [Dothideales sp. JES 119]
MAKTIELRGTRSVEEPETQERLRQDMVPVKRQVLDNALSPGSSTLYSHAATDPDPRVGDADIPLEDLAVDWFLFPHPTSDSWINFLVNHKWEQTALGPLRDWPPILRQMYTTILASSEPRVLYWGKDLCMLYNAAARFVVGEMHPRSLGNSLNDVWGATMLEEILEVINTGIKRGNPVQNKKRELVMMRYGFPESTFFDFVFLPIPSLDGRFLGVLAEFTETTETVLQENRHEISKTFLENVPRAADMQDLWTALLRTLREKSIDVSYAIVYSRSPSVSLSSDAEPLQLQTSYGIEGLGPDVPLAINEALEHSTNEVVVLQQGKNTLPPELASSVPNVGVVTTAYVLSIVGLDGHQLSGIVVLGLNPMRLSNSSSRQFAESLRGLLFKSTLLLSLPDEQRKAQEIVTALSQQLEIVTVKAEKSEQNFTRMLHDAPIGMCVHKSDGYPAYVNDTCLELLGMSRERFFQAEIGSGWRDTVFDEDVEKLGLTWKAVIETREPVYAEFRVKSDSSSTGFRWLETAIQQRYDENGNLEFLYGWLMDVSSRKLTESLVEQRLADALETKRSSENFIDMVRDYRFVADESCAEDQHESRMAAALCFAITRRDQV